MVVQGQLGNSTDIVLVDDVISRGATIIGAADRLRDAFPNTNIGAFGAMRAVGNPAEFEKEFDPQSGVVYLRSDGQSFRRP
jgi:predicted phosphoribosyltransferase